MGLRDRLLGKRSPEDAFVAEIEGLARELLPVSNVERTDRLTLELTFADGNKRTMFLNNVFVEASSAEGEEREQRLRYAVLAMSPVDRPTTWEEAAPMLLPAVRAVSWKYAIGEIEVAARPFLPFVTLLTARDSEYSMAYVSTGDLADWGVEAG